MTTKKLNLSFLIFLLCLFLTNFNNLATAGEEIPASAKLPTDVKIFEDGSKATVLDMSKIDAYKKFKLAFTTPWPKNIPTTEAFLPKDVIINAQTLNEIDTGKVKKGDVIDCIITDNVYLNSTLVIKAGAKVTAVVNYIKPPDRFLIDSVFSADIKETATTNNIPVPLMLEINYSGYNEPPLVTAAVISISTVLVKGSYLKIPAGTHFFVATRENVDLNTKLADLYSTL